MWPAPTAADWKRPVLIEWQRTWDDALAVSKATGKPILICVNMDGEIASEHFAGIRYRDPEKAKLYEPYVNVIASVYRHTPRDVDERGRRIPCPRFGGVTCGEHIAIEPILYRKFFDGKRIAPRHIMVELDGKEQYDVYYALDTDSVFQAIQDGIAKRALKPKPVVRGDRPILERVASRDSQDRAAVEKAYLRGNGRLRRQLLEAAKAHKEAAPIDLLRLAIFGFDEQMSRLARAALAQADSPEAVDVINEALRVPMASGEREALVRALARLGSSSAKARRLATVHRGLGRGKSTLDVEEWATPLAGAEYPAPKVHATLARAVEKSEAVAAARPKDAEAKLALAEASVELAIDPAAASRTKPRLRSGIRSVRNYAQLVFQDARRAALEAERLGAKGWRVDAVLAVIAEHLGDSHEAERRADAAVASMQPGATSRIAMEALQIFAYGRQRRITRAVLAHEAWSPQLLSDVHSAYAILAKHPFGTATHVVSHYDFLRWLGAAGQAARCLGAGLRRYPDSWVLHDRLRAKILAEKGVAGLEPAYTAMLAAATRTGNLEWFAGYASIVAAEFHRRAGNPARALGAYDRAIAHYERAMVSNPSSKASSDHYIAIAMAGRARIALEQGDLESSLEQILAAFRKSPRSAGTLDGLNLRAVDTAKMLRARLSEAKLVPLVRRLQDALDGLAPEALEPPAYERAGRSARGQRRGR